MKDENGNGDDKDDLNVIQRLTRDLASAAVTLGSSEARFMVDAYYMMQDQRKRSANQLRALTETTEPHAVLGWFTDQNRMLENQVKRALTQYAHGHPVGQRMLTVVGIGPVITAGLLAHIDMQPWRCNFATDDYKKKCSENKRPKKAGPHDHDNCKRQRIETAGHIWRFAGQDPTSVWEKGKRRPWNASLKTLCWKVGESFVKQKGHEGCFYGYLYEKRKAYEAGKNDARAYADQAARILKKTPTHKQKETYAQGKLPDSHLHARAKRYAVKLFLAHLHQVWYEIEFKQAPPAPYPLAILGHAHKVEPPF